MLVTNLQIEVKYDEYYTCLLDLMYHAVLSMVAVVVCIWIWQVIKHIGFSMVNMAPISIQIRRKGEKRIPLNFLRTLENSSSS